MTDKKKATPKSWPREGSMGAAIVDQIKKGRDLDTIIALVKAKWPRARASATKGGLGWWKQAMKKHGVKVPAVKAAKKAMKRAAKKAANPNDAVSKAA